MKKISIEEHCLTEGIVNYLRSRKDPPKLEMGEDEKHNKVEWRVGSATARRVFLPELRDKLLDLAEGRIKGMDEAGIDMQVLSVTIGPEELETSEAVIVARKTNDELYRLINKYPKRFSGFAAIAPQDPSTAADELERAVKELGLKGAMINGHIKGEYLDMEKYWVIFERAEKLEVPIYLHPRALPPDMVKPYLTYPVLAASAWGFGAATSLQAMRLIAAGVFDRYPGLKIILGHLGEALPFWMWRIDKRWLNEEASLGPRVTKLRKRPSQYIKENIFVTTSGMFWHPPLMCTYQALGADRILFAVDYPYESNKEAVEFINAAPICENDKEKICHLNAEKLLAL